MNRQRSSLLLLVPTLAATLPAQTSTANTQHAGPQRSFVVVEQSSMRTSQGSWNDSAPMYRYVKEHEGNYVVFSQGGALYRLDKPEQLAEVHRLYEPMTALAARQEALAHAQQDLAHLQQILAHSQQSLAKQQQSLAAKEVAADNPRDQGQIGQGQGTLGQSQGDLGGVQADVGRQQGDFGAIQGELGRQQGEIARAAYARMQTLFDQCLADGSCHRVSL